MPYLLGLLLASLYVYKYPKSEESGSLAELDEEYRANFSDSNGDGWIDSDDGWEGGYLDGVYYNRYNVETQTFYSLDPLGQQDNTHAEYQFSTNKNFKLVVYFLVAYMILQLITTANSFRR